MGCMLYYIHPKNFYSGCIAMKINYEKISVFIENLNNDLKKIEELSERLKSERLRLSENTETEDIVEKIRKTEIKLNEQKEFLLKSKQAFLKIAEVYAAGEERVRNFVENGQNVPKEGFKEISVISDRSGFEWSIT